MTLKADLAGVSDEDKAQCDAWAAAGEELRAAVAWRVFQGKASIFQVVLGVPELVVRHFVDTGEIEDRYRLILEASQ